MEDYVTPALPQRTSGGSGFNYKPPTDGGGNARRQNIFFGSADDERQDSAKYTEAMEQKELHADKGKVTGELMKSKNLGTLPLRERLRRPRHGAAGHRGPCVPWAVSAAAFTINTHDGARSNGSEPASVATTAGT